jgi:hypothetical protein
VFFCERVGLRTVSVSAIFLKKIGSGMHSDKKFGQRGRGVRYIDARKKRFRNGIPACARSRKNFWNGVPSQKYPWFQSSLAWILTASDIHYSLT